MRITLQKLICSDGSILEDYEVAKDFWRSVLKDFSSLSGDTAQSYLRDEVTRKFFAKTEYETEVLVWTLFALLYENDTATTVADRGFAQEIVNSLRKLFISTIFSYTLAEAVELYCLD